jgi:broad specificity phosphatase PhoE
LSTIVFLVRNGATLFREQGRVLGRRDLGLTEEGKAEAARALELLGAVRVDELLSSPLGRAIQTAEFFARHHGVGIGRDPRLIDIDAGKWEGALLAELAAEKAFQDFFAGELDSFPDGENLDAVRRRGIASVEQAAADNPRGANILLVSHAFVIQLIVAHYLGMPTRAALRLRIDRGSVSVLRFVSDMVPPEILGVNLGVPLQTLLAPPARPLSE